MRIPFLFCLLAIALSCHAQKTGFSYYSSHSGVDIKEDGKKFIYTIGEPINTYSYTTERTAPEIGITQQGLLNSERLPFSKKAELQVRVFFDQNADGVKGSDEPYITEGNVQVQGSFLFKLTNAEGIKYYADPGTYTFEYFNQNDLFTYTNTRSIEVEVTEDDKYLKVDFGLAPDDIIERAYLYLDSDRFRCFRRIEHRLNVKNEGSVKLIQTVYLELDDRLEPATFYQQPDIAITDNIVGWEVCLEPGESVLFTFDVQAPEVDSPDDVGVIYFFKSWLDLQNNGTLESLNESELEQELLCSYDPNDKLVRPSRPDSLALLDEPLIYKVRFQNTGNDVADDVVVTDTLDRNLDMSTFDILDSSHPDQLQVLIDEDNENIVNFQFKNVFLPDSTTNEPASNGYVAYSISPKEGLPINTAINNTAHIYFDFNPAIVTNTTSSTLVDTFPIPKEDIITEVTHIMCTGESYQGYTETGVFEDTFATDWGYDSIRILKLFAIEPKIETVMRTICDGDSYRGYTETGFYRDTLSSAGCGVFLEIELEVSNSYQSYEQIELCFGETYKGYTGAGLFVERYKTFSDCDSIHSVELIVSGGHETISKQICEGDSYEGYMEAGSYEDLIITSNGCDSLRTLELTIIDKVYSETLETICSGESYEGYTETGLYQESYVSSLGCDSIRFIDLVVEENRASYQEYQICEGESYEGYTVSGTYQDIFSGTNGCDSTRTLELNVLQPISITVDQQICEGDDFEGYTESGTYEENLTSIEGCDSTRVIILSVLPNLISSQDVKICDGESFENHTTSGTYTSMHVSSVGCDSTSVINLTVENNITENVSVEICSGEDHLGYSETGIYQDVYTSAQGCDSIRILDLIVNPAYESYEEVYLCIGEMYQGFSEPGLYSQNYEAKDGCDSVRYVDIIWIERGDPICAFQFDEDPKSFDDTRFLSVYPNPTTDIINIVVDKPSRLPSTIEILSIDQKLLHRQEIYNQTTPINVSDYQAGIYILIIKSGLNIYVHRIIKS